MRCRKMDNAWNNKNEQYRLNHRNIRESFLEHNTCMMKFSQTHAVNLASWHSSNAKHNKRMGSFWNSHPSNLVVKSSRRELIDKIWPLLFINSMREAGGSRVLIEPARWPNLTLMSKVETSEFWQN